MPDMLDFAEIVSSFCKMRRKSVFRVPTSAPE